jgi:hypothetical protein
MYLYIMSRFNTSTSHPIIPNSNEYLLKKKYVSIHSEDRNIDKYPHSTDFEIELPQDYMNVQGIRLSDWTFPCNYNVFSQDQLNVIIAFQITNPYNPGEVPFYSPLQEIIFEALYYNSTKKYYATIEDGCYTPTQMATELTNKMNEAIYDFLYTYIETNNASLLSSFVTKGYDQFVVAYHKVNHQLWFGHKSAEFKILAYNDFSDVCNTTEDPLIYTKDSINICKSFKSSSIHIDYSNWGLPVYLGFGHANVVSEKVPASKPARFYYGDALVAGDKGYWLSPDPDLPDSTPTYLNAPYKINLLGESYFYMEIDNLNNMDETMPYTPNHFTRHTNETNGVVNSAFAKIPANIGEIEKIKDTTMNSYMLFQPPAERIRKIKIRLRYHNGALVNFGSSNFSFTLEFIIFDAQLAKKTNMYVPETVQFSGGRRY